MILGNMCNTKTTYNRVKFQTFVGDVMPVHIELTISIDNNSSFPFICQKIITLPRMKYNCLIK